MLDFHLMNSVAHLQLQLEMDKLQYSQNVSSFLCCFLIIVHFVFILVNSRDNFQVETVLRAHANGCNALSWSPSLPPVSIVAAKFVYFVFYFIIFFIYFILIPSLITSVFLN